MAKRSKVVKSVARFDAYRNRRTGVGTSSDPAYYTTYCADILSNEEARELYRGNDIAKKVVEYRVKAAFREGFEIKTRDKELSEEISAALEDLGARDAFRRAGFAENWCGGSAILPIINDGTDLSQPLTPGRMVKMENLLVLEGRELYAVSHYRSIFDPKFGQPMRYRFEPRNHGGAVERGQLIHESRLIVFPGVRVTRDQVSVNRGWGDSNLNRPNQVIKQFGITWDGVASLLHRIEQGVYKVDGLADAIKDDGLGVVEAGLLDIDRMRSLLKMLVIDGKDDYIRVGVPLTGVPETLEKMMLRLAAACEMPAAFLVGMSPTGLNSTGDAETRSWYDSVAEEQNDHFGPRVSQLVKMYMQTNDSVTRGKEPDVWSVEWRPLWQPTAKEQAETNDVQASADDKYIQNGTLTPTIVRRNRFGGDTASLSTTVTEQEMNDLEQLAATPTDEELAAAGETDPNADPNAAPIVAAGTSGDIQKEALNGAQVSSLIEVITAVNTKALSRMSGQKILELAFQLSTAEAVALLGPPDFEPVKEEPKPNPFARPFAAPKPNEPPAKEEEDDAPVPDEAKKPPVDG